MIPRKKLTTSFTRTDLTDPERLTGSIFSTLNIAVLQNMRTDIAEQKIHLEFTPNDVLAFTQQEAFLAGQLTLLEHLISTSEQSQKQVVELSAVQPPQQN